MRSLGSHSLRSCSLPSARLGQLMAAHGKAHNEPDQHCLHLQEAHIGFLFSFGLYEGEKEALSEAYSRGQGPQAAPHQPLSASHDMGKTSWVAWRRQPPVPCLPHPSPVTPDPQSLPWL